MSNEKLNLFQKLNKIMEEVPYLQKNSSVGFGNNSYNAITHDYVTTKVQPKFAKYGVVAIPSIKKHNFDRYEVQTKKGTSLRYEVKVELETTFYNSDKPEEKVSITTIAQGFDSQDKASGKAHSMAAKYAYLKVLGISSGDNEEERMAEQIFLSEHIGTLREELLELLKKNGKYASNTEGIVNKLSYEQLSEKIEAYRK